MLLSCQNIHISFQGEPVLTGGFFRLEEKEKAAVVGINGAGKTTLLNLIASHLAPEEGEILLSRNSSLGFLSQHHSFEASSSLYDEVASAQAEIFSMEEKLRQLEHKMSLSAGEELSGLMEEYDKLSFQFENLGGYALRSKIAGVLKGLGFNEGDWEKPCSLLSGGEKTRVALGRLLLSEPDLILLDEPTNHLDIASVSWLENYLKDYPGAVLVVSHDRYFMDKIAGKIIEIENGKISMYSGNYSSYAEKKAKEREISLKHYYNQQRMIRHEEEVIAKLKSFNREKSIRRAESREKMLDKVEILEKPHTPRDDMRLVFTPSVLSGEDVLSVRGLSKRFGEKVLFSHVDLPVRRGEKIALIGDNGCGKTTMIKIISGRLSPDEGEIHLGAKVGIGYYDQEQHLFDEKNTLFDEMRLAFPRMSDTQIRNALAAFLFTGDDVFKSVSVLSGGEKARLSLAKLMLSPCNFLLLDEPTNHLDITSREILEEALSSYEGTLLFVSHDRYFINRIAQRTLELKDGALRSFLGNYDFYLEKKEEALAAGAPVLQDNADISEANRLRLEKKAADTKRRRLENDLKKTESAIEEMESGIRLLEETMASESVSRDAVRLMELSRELEEKRAELEELYRHWEELISG